MLLEAKQIRRINNILLVIILIIIVRTAWINDDAYITMRTVHNFVNGNGLVYNLGERVQSFTHPLWMFAVAIPYFFSRHAYYSLIILSILVSMAAILYLSKKVSHNEYASSFGLFAILFSKAFIDFSTSGLENPLSHLLLVLFVLIFLDKETGLKKLFRISIITALVGLNRLDLLLVVFPALVFTLFEIWSAHIERKGKLLISMAAGFLPLLLWFVFSLVYYGFIFPNTAYAKLDAGIPREMIFSQGLHYYFNLLYTNAPTFLVIFSGLVVAFLSRNRKLIVLASGVLLYLGYILSIGGDFMSGRFFTAPFLVALVIILRSERISNLRTLAIPLVVIVMIGASSPFNSNFAGAEYGHRLDRIMDKFQIADERAFYYPATGLLRVFPEGDITQNNRWAAEGLAYRESGLPFAMVGKDLASAGFFGYFVGPEVWCVDELGLVDPLLARLPTEYETFWRIGHNLKTMPDGYRETLIENKNLIVDPDISKFYDHLSLITRGALFDPSRWETIWKMNTGQYDHLLP